MDYFREEDIMTHRDFYEIENWLDLLNHSISNHGYSIPEYNYKSWTVQDNLYDIYLNNIEEGIFNLGKYYYRPLGWQKTKQWHPLMSFSYKDVNRWINNLNLIQEAINKESSMLLPSDTLYPSDTLLPR